MSGASYVSTYRSHWRAVQTGFAAGRKSSTHFQEILIDSNQTFLCPPPESSIPHGWEEVSVSSCWHDSGQRNLPSQFLPNCVPDPQCVSNPFILYFKFAPRLFVQKRSNRQRYLWVELFSIWTHPVSWLLLIHVTTALSWAAQKYHLKLGWPRPPLSYSGSNLYITKYNWWSYFIAVCHTNHLCCFSVFIYHKLSDELMKEESQHCSERSKFLFFSLYLFLNENRHHRYWGVAFRYWYRYKYNGLSSGRVDNTCISLLRLWKC